MLIRLPPPGDLAHILHAHQSYPKQRPSTDTHAHTQSSRINAITTPKKANTLMMGPTTPKGQALAAALNGWTGDGDGGGDHDAYVPARIPCVNLFDVRQEFRDVQEVGVDAAGVYSWNV